MKIEVTDTCFGIYTEIDGRSWADIPMEERETLLEIILQGIAHRVRTGDIEIREIVVLLEDEEWKDLGECEQCSHSSSSTTYILPCPIEDLLEKSKKS